MLTLVPGCTTGMFLSVRCSVTFSQLRRKQKARAWRQRHKSCSSLTRKAFIRSPALVCFDLLSHELFVGRLRSLLSHRHQLDQLRPEDAGKHLSQTNLLSVITSFIRTLHPKKIKAKKKVCVLLHCTPTHRSTVWPRTNLRNQTSSNIIKPLPADLTEQLILDRPVFTCMFHSLRCHYDHKPFRDSRRLGNQKTEL